MHKRFFLGFTVAELAIAISVIGILAAITTVTYRGAQLRANDTSVQNDMKKLQDEILIYESDNTAQLPAASFQASIQGVRVNKKSYATSVNALLYCSSTDSPVTKVTMIGQSKSGTKYEFTNDEKLAVYTGAFSSASPVAACQAAASSALSFNYVWINTGGSNSGTWLSNV